MVEAPLKGVEAALVVEGISLQYGQRIDFLNFPYPDKEWKEAAGEEH